MQVGEDEATACEVATLTVPGQFSHEVEWGRGRTKSSAFAMGISSAKNALNDLARSDSADVPSLERLLSVLKLEVAA